MKKEIIIYIPDLNVKDRAGGCKFCLTNIKEHSKHNITLCGLDDINEYRLDDYDIIHTHSIHDKILKTKSKVVWGVHGYSLNCPVGGYSCCILNKFLEPLNCLDCLGYIGVKTGFNNMKKWHELARKSSIITVDSKYMCDFYHAYNPVFLPLPLETDTLIQSNGKEDYLFYTGRLSNEKNPYGFIDIVNRIEMKGKMAIYNTTDDIIGLEDNFKEVFNNDNIEIFLNPTKEEMINLVRHAKFTMLPYLFAEPFGVAAANSVLCGTPLVTFPYGNVRYMTHLLPRSLDEMIELLKMNDNQYKIELERTLKKSDELRELHNPINSAKRFDELYDNLN